MNVDCIIYESFSYLSSYQMVKCFKCKKYIYCLFSFYVEGETLSEASEGSNTLIESLSNTEKCAAKFVNDAR